MVVLFLLQAFIHVYIVCENWRSVMYSTSLFIVYMCVDTGWPWFCMWPNPTPIFTYECTSYSNSTSMYGAVVSTVEDTLTHSYIMEINQTMENLLRIPCHSHVHTPIHCISWYWPTSILRHMCMCLFVHETSKVMKSLEDNNSWRHIINKNVNLHKVKD